MSEIASKIFFPFFLFFLIVLFPIANAQETNETLEIPENSIHIFGEVLNITLYPSWTLITGPANCTFTPVDASTLELTGYDYNCRLPFNITLEESETVRLPLSIARNLDLNLLSAKQQEITELNSLNLIYLVALISVGIAFGGYFLYREVYTQQE